MIKRVYAFLYFTTLFALLGAVLVSMALFQKDVVPYLAQNYLKEYDVEYKGIDGTLFGGVVIRGVKYKDSVEVDELRVKYNLLMLMSPTPRLSSISAKGVFVDADKILETKSAEESSAFALNISKVDIQNVKVAYKEEIYGLNLKALDVSIRETVDVRSIAIEAETPYAKSAIEGSIKANRAKGRSTLSPSEKFHNEYLGFLTYAPSELELFFDISSKEAEMKTSLKSVVFKDIEDLVLENIELHAAYSFSDDFFTLSSDYTALYEKNEILVEQKSRVGVDGKVVSNLEAKIVQDELGLPFDRFSVAIKSDE
ncbi:MAG TPA: hypothetical protein VIM82_02215, partial [Sulfurimonas sp.]